MKVTESSLQFNFKLSVTLFNILQHCNIYPLGGKVLFICLDQEILMSSNCLFRWFLTVNSMLSNTSMSLVFNLTTLLNLDCCFNLFVINIVQLKLLLSLSLSANS